MIKPKIHVDQSWPFWTNCNDEILIRVYLLKIWTKSNFGQNITAEATF